MAEDAGFRYATERFFGQVYDAEAPARMVRRGRELTLVEHARPTGPGDADLSLVVRARLRRPLHRERLVLEAWLVAHPAWRARLQEEGSGVRWDLARQAPGIAFTWADPRSLDWTTARFESCLATLVDLADALDSGG